MSQPGRRPLIGDTPTLPKAACRPADASIKAVRAAHNLFFGRPGERPAEAEQRKQQALAICAACPELEACRTWALAHPTDIGDYSVSNKARTSPTYVGQIIGGMTAQQRWAERGEPAAPQATHRARRQLPIKHGSVGGRDAHRRRFEDVCDECAAAYADYQRNYDRTRTGRPDRKKRSA